MDFVAAMNLDCGHWGYCIAGSLVCGGLILSQEASHCN